MTIPPPIPLVRQKDGSFSVPLDRQIEERMRPPVPERDRWFWLRAAGYFIATLAIGLGVLMGMVILCGFAAVFWVLNKVRNI